THEDIKKSSYKLLEAARSAEIQAKCDSVGWQTTRALIGDELQCIAPTLMPYPWQLDVGEALTLGLDCAVIAGTGASKTLPFIMPILADSTKSNTVLVISPLNVLEEDQ
ncbi:hypothetical protein K439DRAFT_1297543, partial [Ramaria rubella]